MTYSRKFSDRIKSYYRISLPRRTYFLIIITVFTFLTWLLAFPLFGPLSLGFLVSVKALAIEKGRAVQLFLAMMIISSLLSGFLVDKLKKNFVFIYLSALLCSVVSISIIFFSRISDYFLVYLVLGFLTGLSPAAVGAFLAENVSPEERGRVLSIPVGASMAVAYLFLLNDPQVLTKENGVMVISVILACTLSTFLLRVKTVEEVKPSKSKKNADLRTVMFYSAPILLFYWTAGILFSIVFPTLLDHISKNVFYIVWVIPFLTGSLIGGILIDTLGRRILMMIGLAIMGIALAIFGIWGIDVGVVFMLPLSIGFSFVALTSLIIWGDLAPAQSRGLYYGAGVSVIALAILLGLFTTGSVFGSTGINQVKSYLFFSSIALFLAIPPLIFVEEILPKELVDKRKLQEYLELAKKKYIDRSN
jgi:MFS family permease